ncbi:hypothetical protein SAMN05192551_101304 [Tindallia magadiensis]|uniref:DUF116 domain-containing protein n=1 Tax=Tindallia magadiensis TaxID=69895 RepID=A0A1I3AND4_9FIRM|nr:DUF116 domain-containing protein [Tindallia magadiensis]SFH51219.1 hypothetical protein SAMN05192551_101304 [Tindallia magadiensis]
MRNEINDYQNVTKNTIGLLMISISISLLLILLVGWLTVGGHMSAYIIFNGIALITFISFFMMLLVSLYTYFRICYNKSVSVLILKWTKHSLKWIYPFLKMVGKLIKRDKNDVRKAFTLLNNKLTMSECKSYHGKDILLVTPHCLQKAHCSIKVTNSIALCQECGMCNVGDLKYLQQTYGVQCDVVTGGTLARKRIKEKKPKLIIAIACERDLVSGLMDVKGIPVYAIINERPEGPCYNTIVQKKEVEDIIKYFLRGEKK